MIKEETKTEFKLNSNQHDKIVNEVKNGYRNQVDGKLQFRPTTNFKKKNGKLEEAIKNKPNLFEEKEENRENEIVICLKRKRDETPLEELFIETPKKKVNTMKEIVSNFENLNFKNENLIHKFTLFQSSNEKEIDSSKDLIENIKKRKNFKIIETEELNKKKKQEKLKEKTKENRLIKINKSRNEDLNILKVEFEDKEKFEPFLNLLEKYGEKVEIEKDQYDYDYYYFTEKIKENIENIPNLIKFDETLTFEDEYFEDDDDSDIDSMDSNREDYYKNDYPEDEVYTSEDELEEEVHYLNEDDYNWNTNEDDISIWDNRNDQEYNFEL
eukprot:gene5412-9225_t